MESPHKGKTGLRRLYNAFWYSMAGFRAAFQHEDAFRMEVLLSVVLIPLSLSSFTSLSCSVANNLSTLPLACGEYA